MKEVQKAPYVTPNFIPVFFATEDVLLLTQGGDSNEGTWRPVANALQLDIFENM